MTSLQALAVLAIRLIAIWLLVSSTRQLLWLIAAFAQPDPFSYGGQLNSAFFVSLAAGGLAIMLPTMLLLYSRSIALWATPKNSPHIAGLNIHTEGMTRLAMAIIGLFLVASAFPEAGGGLIRLSIEALRSIKDPNHISFGESWIPGLPEQFAKLALGIALFLTAFRIAPFLRPLRRAGTGAHLDAPTSSSQSKERS